MLTLLCSGAVVGNLWDVTDRDIDAYTETLLTSWNESPQKSLVSFVASSRKVCKLKYMNGASPICYGVPMYQKYVASSKPKSTSSRNSHDTAPVTSVKPTVRSSPDSESDEDSEPEPITKISKARTSLPKSKTTTKKSTTRSRLKKT